MSAATDRLGKARKLALGSVAVAVVVIALKYLAYRMTGSIALYSDALESVVNLVAAAIALFAVQLAAKPADQTHNFGHHKAEYLSAVTEGVLVVVAALLILHEAAFAIYNGHVLPEGMGPGIIVNLAAAALNGLWAVLLIRQGRALLSPALTADGNHLMSDVLTSLGVVVGLVAAISTGIALLDPLMAIVVAASVLWQGYKVISFSLDGLMDKAPDDNEMSKIRSAIKQSMDGALEYHDLKVRIAGAAAFVDLHLVVSGAMSVEKSHEICDRIEAAIRADHPGAVIQIHVEPEHKAKHRKL